VHSRPLPRIPAVEAKANEMMPITPQQQTVHRRWMSADFQRRLASVIVPTYNRADLAAEAFDSVWRQTYRPIELLVIDDGSSEDVAGVIDQLQQRSAGDDSFTVRFLVQPHAGAPAARNLGLIESRGQFIQFLDSDDVLHPHKLAAGVTALQQNPSADYVWTNRAHVDDAKMADFIRESLNARPVAYTASWVPARNLAWTPYQSFGLFRRDICLAMGPWNETLVRAQDWEYTTRLVCHTQHILKIKESLYGFREHDRGRITDLTKTRRRSMDAMLAAARAAEDYVSKTQLSRVAASAVRLRLARHYFRILRHSIRSGSTQHFALALAGMKRSAAGSFAAGDARRKAA
jgi:glycosyltransferase involved in cell wall biosynthesis